MASASSSNNAESYALLLAGFGALFFGLHRLSKCETISDNPAITNRDLALLAIATHKITRTVAKDRVTYPIREPFVKEDPVKHKEVSKGQGLRKALGDLLTCHYCLGPWVATGLVFSFKIAPKFTRKAAMVFTAVTASDFLHMMYQGLKARVEEPIKNPPTLIGGSMKTTSQDNLVTH